MNKNLFQDFQEVSEKEWKQKIQVDLNGEDYNKKLIWKSRDGIDVKPFYHLDSQHEEWKVPIPKKWNIVQQIYVSSVASAKKEVKYGMENGTESFWLTIPSPDIDVRALIEQISPTEHPLYIRPLFFSLDYFLLIDEAIDKQFKVYLQLDPIGDFAREGNWRNSKEKDLSSWKHLMIQTKKLQKVISIDGQLYQNAGANIVQQLAYTCSHGNEYLNLISDLDPDQMRLISFHVVLATGSNYFFEIAKIKAIRLLFDLLSKEYRTNNSLNILAIPSKRNKTLFDYNVNMLRTTTECMSAVLGGANSVCNLAYDSIFRKKNEFSTRIARNQLLILKNESQFEEIDPASGTFYIESLTSDFTEKSLDLFKLLERGGGFLSQLHEGKIQEKISQSASEEQAAFNKQELALVGSNLFPDTEERIGKDLELYPFLKRKPRKTLIPPIIPKRLSEELEQKRLNEENEQKES